MIWKVTQSAWTEKSSRQEESTFYFHTNKIELFVIFPSSFPKSKPREITHTVMYNTEMHSKDLGQGQISVNLLCSDVASKILFSDKGKWLVCKPEPSVFKEFRLPPRPRLTPPPPPLIKKDPLAARNASKKRKEQNRLD